MIRSHAIHEPIEILMVEDNPSDVRLTKEALKDAKVWTHLYVIEDGIAALDFLSCPDQTSNGPRPDLILLDLNLPRKSGHEVLAVLKSNDRLKSIPVIILTSSQAKSDVLDAYALHANFYITKPADLADFTHMVNTIEAFWLSTVTLPGK